MDQIKTRAYFLEQGQGINRLRDLLDSSFLFGFFKRGISILFEGILYLVFVLMLVVVFLIPTDPIQWGFNLNDTSRIHATYENEELRCIVIVFKVFLFVCSLVPVALAILLGRNRRKGAVISEAFEVVGDMKKKFDKAVKELPL